MRLNPKEHLEYPWLVSTLAADFKLLDVWRYPIEIELGIPLDRFIEFAESSQGELVSKNGPAGALFRLRAILGKVFRWDDELETPSEALPIPGCRETSLRDRLSDAVRETQTRPSPSSSKDRANSGFKLVYRLENESLREISNKTVHALMHLGRVQISATHWSPQMAVYVKTRGILGRGYMALITPFRHYIVYPAIMRAAKRGWPSYAARHRTAARGQPSPPG
ncbi:MAG: DUF2867 domain-containing protein [Deltaproteobacteria bacterium]|nr:DUF2867 domain-containing protein [Deltaproteobacteria bacterium]MBW2723717.1 DUF2867 domain-containing protein [Deltaproteobacteria bacterium]